MRWGKEKTWNMRESTNYSAKKSQLGETTGRAAKEERGCSSDVPEEESAGRG